jgi:hypothetical protein
VTEHDLQDAGNTPTKLINHTEENVPAGEEPL